MPDEPILPAPPDVPQILDSDTLSGENTIVSSLEGYRQEAEQNRRSGLNPRDDRWSQNLDLYWNRYDFSNKASWQSRAVMPEVPSFVDRFAAALKEALVAVPDSFYTVQDPADKENDLASAIKRMTDVWLSTCGSNQTGHIVGFPAVFEEQMKLGALMACSAVVKWRKDTKFGRVSIEAEDPRNVWLDHTGRGLYRIRRIEVDRHELVTMANAKDGKGKPLFNLPEVDRLVSHMEREIATEREALSGTGQQVISSRMPIVLHEYIATILGSDGKAMHDSSLCVVANGQFLVRGPEKIPFWHGRDWMLYTPLVTTPLSIYGRSYMEDFGEISRTFTDLTNMILDAVFTSSMKVFAMAPGLLLDPSQASRGISPNMTFLLEDGVRPQDFFKDMDMGALPAEAVSVWQALKSELREAAGINEIGLGQFAPKGRTSATEIAETQQSSSALIRGVAQTIESRLLNPMLDLTWKTGVQHVSKDDEMVRDAVGQEMFQALISRRKELAKHPVTFQAQGISRLIQKSQMRGALIQLLQVVGSNEQLLAEFLKVVDISQLIRVLFELSDIDLTKFQASEREKMIRDIATPLQDAQNTAQSGGPPASNGAGREAQELASLVQGLGGA